MNIEQAKALKHPEMVMIQTTSKCNSACVICPYPSVAKTLSHKDMDPALYKNLIDEIATYPSLDRLMLYLMNEPLCDKKIPERIAYARSKLPDTEIYILTNGILLNDDTADRIIDSGLSWIGLSVHAIEPDTYQKITGRKDFDKIKGRLSRFIEKGLKANGDDFVQVNITRVRPYVSEEEFEKAAGYWRSLGMSRVDLDNGYISRAGNVKVHGHDPVMRTAISGCDTLWAYRMAHVLCDGTVIPCCMDWKRKVIFGNATEKSLLDIWRDEKRIEFLDRIGSCEPLPEDFLCASCEDAIPAPQACETCDENKVDEPEEITPDILLVSPPPWLPYSPPLGLASLAAYLKDRGFIADVFDANIELHHESPESLQKLWEWEQGPNWEKPHEVDRIFGDQLDAYAETIAEHPAPVIGFSVASRKEYPLTRMIHKLMGKAPDKTLIFGGPGIHMREDRDRIHALIGHEVAATGKDILYGFVIGEGEATLAETMEHLREGATIEGIDGLAIYREGGQAFYQPRKEIADLSELPFPDFSGFPLNKYTHPSLTIEWSRGCIGRCAFCNIRGLWGRYRHKPALRVLDELQYLVETYDKRWFSLCDPVINGRPDVLEEICDGIFQRGLDIKWSAGISPVRELEPGLFEKMKKAGCYRLEFGVESASDPVLKKMGKRYDADSAGRMLKNCKNAGIEVVIYLIVGFPGEAEDDFEKTLDFIRAHADDIDMVRSVNGLILVIGSPIEREPEKFGIDELHRDEFGWVSRWVSGDLTPSVRVDRIDRALKVLEEAGVQAEFSNREEVMAEKDKFAGRVTDIEKRFDSFEERMRAFMEKQDKVLRGEPVRENPFADQIALVLCPVWGSQMPPLGMAYLASFLENQGWKPSIIDFNIELFHGLPDNLKQLFAEDSFRHWTDLEGFARIRTALSGAIDALVDRLIESNCKVIGFSVYSPNRLFTIEVCRRLKKRAPDRTLVAGGRGVFTANERLLFPPESIDYFVVGEGETSFIPLLEAIFSDRDGAKLPGVVRFEGVHLTDLNPRPLYDDLTIFPHPSFNGFNLGAYTDPELPLLFSRGCPGHCTFCNDHKAMGHFRGRPADHMAAEIFSHIRKLDRREFKFNDQCINGDLAELETLCDLIIEEGEEINWIALAQPKGDMQDRLLHKMKKAGCFTLNLGVESGSDKILKRMGKGFSVADIEKALKQIFSAGINTMVNFIVGFPGETEDDFNETLEFIRRNREWICGVTSVNSLIILEGSPLEKGAKSFGIQYPDKEKDVNWWSGDNTPMIRRQRLEKLVALLDELEIMHLVSNLDERHADLDAMELPPPCDEQPGEMVETPEEHPQHSSCLPPEKDFDSSKGEPYFEPIDKSPADILLVLAPVWGTDVAPLGPAYLAAAVEQSGKTAAVLDLNIKLFNRAKDHTLWRMESYKYWTDPELAPITFESFADLVEHYVAEIADHPAPVIGFSVFTGNFPFTIHIAEKIRIAAPDKTIIFGGPGITNSFDIAKITKNHGDYMVLGEAEYVLIDYLQKDKKGETSNTKLMLEVGSEIDFENLPKALIKDINPLAFPTFEHFDLSEYETDAIPVIGSRGCIRRCSFCNDHHIYQKYRQRDPKKLFEEVLYHVKKRGVDRFSFLDVLINARPKELETFCDLVINSGIQIHWGGQGVIREDMSLELLKKMKAAGCMSMVYGVESFSDKVLKLMNKPYTQTIAEKILRRTHEAGLETIINIIVGFPGETDEDFDTTYNFIKNNQDIIDQVASISPCLINLGSRLFDRYEEYGIRFPEAEGSIKWYTEEGNTFEIRRKRLLELTSLLSDREKSVHTVNLYDEKREDFEYIEHEDHVGGNELDDNAKDEKEGKQPDAFLALLPPWGVEFPPIGLASLATYATSKGFDVISDDYNIRWYDLCGEQLKSYWDPEHLKFWVPGQKLDTIIDFLAPAIDDLIAKAKELNPLLVGFSTNESNLYLTEIVAKKIKAALPESLVVFGGPGVSWPLDRDRVDPTSLDGFVVGEGEETLVDLLSRLQKGYDLGDVPGYEPVDSPRGSVVLRELIRPLENIPTPEFDIFPLHLYTRRDIPLLFSRGCINRCAFCNDHQLTPKFRIKKPETLFAEVQKYKKELAGFEFAFNDLLVNADLNALGKFCDLIIESEMRLAWTGQAVIDKNMDEAYMKKLAAAGCVSLVFGAESFSPDVLKAMRKRFAPDDAKAVFKSANAAGIEVIVNIIVGFPGEGNEQFTQTMDFIRENSESIDRISALSTCIVVANCALEKDPDKYGIVLPKPEHWRQWYSKDGDNTYQIRTKRLRKALDLFEELSIKHNMTNLYVEALEERCD